MTYMMYNIIKKLKSKFKKEPKLKCFIEEWNGVYFSVYESGYLYDHGRYYTLITPHGALVDTSPLRIKEQVMTLSVLPEGAYSTIDAAKSAIKNYKIISQPNTIVSC